MFRLTEVYKLLLLLIFENLILYTAAIRRDCTSSGHYCVSVNSTNPLPCRSGENVMKSGICKDSGYRKGCCDYCPESHEAALDGPSYQPGLTACRQEDGFYKCQFAKKDNCIRRTWIRRVAACHVYNETTVVRLNCTDDEIKCRFLSRCLKRYDINSEFGCETERRKFYIRCHEDEFECKFSRKCLPRTWVRDGSFDCSVYEEIYDTSDEDQPLSSCYPQTEFRCQDQSGRCIPREMVMDGRFNCPESSDENQALVCLNTTEFTCRFRGRCIPRYRVNDGFPDCPRGSDENLADFPCKLRTEFDCGDGRCIPRAWVGNSLFDCKSGIDESATLTSCSHGEFKCLDSSRCLPKKYLCDGIKNCEDCSDEVELCDEPRLFRCKADPSVCIAWTQTCDDSDDCADRSDENTHLLQGFKCLSGEKRYCYVPQFMLSTKVSMCLDTSNFCYDDKGRFLCARCLDGKRIISKSQVCDGVIDCDDLSDECPCEDSVTEEVCQEVFKTSNSGQYMDLRAKVSSICNGKNEWNDNMDEKFCSSPFISKSINVSHEKDFDYVCQSLSEEFYNYSRQYGLWAVVSSEVNLRAKKCDGIIECVLFDDECSNDCLNQPAICQASKMVEWKFERNNTETARACPNALNYFQSLFPSRLCDGLAHCDGGEDEKNCTDRFYCDAGRGKDLGTVFSPIVSIKADQRCDLKIDCIDASDEKNCSTKTHFYCEHQQPLFVDIKKYLDGFDDCGDYSDECPINVRFGNDPFSSRTELLRSVVLRILIWIVACTSLLGNIWVIVTTIADLKKITSKNSVGYSDRVLIVNLACADLLTGVCLCIIIAKSLQFSGEYCRHDNEWKLSLTCNLIGALLLISSQTSLNIITTLTAFRLYGVLSTLRTIRINRYFTFFVAFLSWITSVFVAIFPLFAVHFFSTSAKISRSLYFKSDVADQNTLDRYYIRSNILGSLYSNTSVISSSKEEVTLFPERYVEIVGVYGYYSSNSVCFPDFFKIPVSQNYYSLGIIVYNTLSILFIAFSYLLLYKKSSSTTIATRIGGVQNRNAEMKKRITLLVASSTACWMPICAMAFYNFYTNNLPPFTSIVAAVVLLPIDSCFNPILYSQAHKKAFKFIQGLILRRFRSV